MFEIDKSKTTMSEEHVLIFWQTIADIVGEKNNVRITAIREKEGVD